MQKKKSKIVVGTRTKKENYEECFEKMQKFEDCDYISRIYIICNLQKEIKGHDKIKIVYDSDPIRQCAFNLIIDKLRQSKDAKNEYHFLAYSKEVELEEKNIEEMIREIDRNSKNLIVAGYKLEDNILSKEEQNIFSNGDQKDDIGIAYRIPWNTCALWNKKFIYSNGLEELRFDEICEKNQLGNLDVEVNGKIMSTPYKGMEDGLAIARLQTFNKRLKYKLLKPALPWNISGDEKRIEEKKIMMARKNIVLSTFINLKGYKLIINNED